MLHKAEKDVLFGGRVHDRMRVGCGKELLAMLQEAIQEQRDRLIQAKNDSCTAFTLGGTITVRPSEHTVGLLQRQERRLHDLDLFVQTHRERITAVS